MSLFKNINQDEIALIKSYFKVVNLDKNEYICHEGDYLDSLYLVEQGKIEISRYDLNGHKNMIGIMKKNDMFAESIVLSNQKQAHVNIMALSKSRLLKISNEDLYLIDNINILRNLIEIMADKNIYLNKKINCLSKKTVKEKLYEYLKNLFIINNSLEIDCEYNINQLADYLCINRSSLSREIALMIDEDYFKIDQHKYYLNPKYFKM